MLSFLSSSPNFCPSIRNSSWGKDLLLRSMLGEGESDKFAWDGSLLLHDPIKQFCLYRELWKLSWFGDTELSSYTISNPPSLTIFILLFLGDDFRTEIGVDDPFLFLSSLLPPPRKTYGWITWLSGAKTVDILCRSNHDMTLSYRHIITKTFLDVIVSDEKFCVLNLKIETLVLKKHLSYVSKISSTIIRSSAILSCIFKIINRYVRH